MAGLARICKAYGRMKVGDISYVWDYAADKAVPEEQMPIGSERWKASERARRAIMADPLPSPYKEGTGGEF